jgi:hypothetical protein
MRVTITGKYPDNKNSVGYNTNDKQQNPEYRRNRCIVIHTIM